MSKLPAPLVGTAAHPGPKLAEVRLAIIVVELPFMAVVAVEPPDELLESLLSLPQATAPTERAAARPTVPAILSGEKGIGVLL
jgi:hypothetical protein